MEPVIASMVGAGVKEIYCFCTVLLTKSDSTDDELDLIARGCHEPGEHGGTESMFAREGEIAFGSELSVFRKIIISALYLQRISPLQPLHAGKIRLKRQGRGQGIGQF